MSIFNLVMTDFLFIFAMLKTKINEGDLEHFRYVFARGLSANDQSDFVQYILPASTESSRLLTGIIQKS